MKKELQSKLINDFPGLYTQVNWPKEKTCMCWGLAIGDGWFNIVYDLSKKITEIAPEVQVVQVKEKFGGLRFYTGSVLKDHSDNVYKLINEAEEKSFKTCEICGTIENVTTNGPNWIKTLCDKCRKKNID